MEDKKEFEAIIRKNNVITIPPEIRELLNIKQGDLLIFKIDKNHIIVGGVKRTIIQEEIKFNLKENEK